MARQGLLRLPYYPQLRCLDTLHPQASLIMSGLLFWMSRTLEPHYCPQRHNFQLALHLGLTLDDFRACFAILEQHKLFTEHRFLIQPKEVTATSKVKEELRLTLNFEALLTLLEQQGCHGLSVKLLRHAADDSFDFYDVIDEREIPLVQKLDGFLEDQDYEKAAFALTYLAVAVNEEQEEFAQRAIAPGWKLLLNVPLSSSIEDYAKELVQRYLRSGERAIDFSFTDGTFFFPDYVEIKNLSHEIHHSNKRREAHILAAAFMLLLASLFPEKLIFTTEIKEDEVNAAHTLLDQYRDRIENAIHARASNM